MDRFERSTLTLRRRDRLNISMAAVVWATFGSLSTSAIEVGVVRIDGTTVTGEWIGSANGEFLDLKTERGNEAIPIDGISQLTIRAAPVRKRSSSEPAAAVFHLADGGRLLGTLLEPPHRSDALMGQTVLGDAMVFPFDLLSGIQLIGGGFPRARELFFAALAERLPGQDVLITRSIDDVRTVRGQLQKLDVGQGSFMFGGRIRTFQAEKIYGVVFAGRVARKHPPPFPLTLTLNDGSVFSGRLKSANAGSLHLATSLGQEVDLPLELLTGVAVYSRRVVYLSDLTPVGERSEGLLHRPWSARMDRSVSGGRLSIGGRTFDKGIGVHSRTELTYRIDKAYETFAATIGIDDAVRPRGSAVFIVTGDGKERFNGATLTGNDAPVDIIVDLADVTTLTLTVDYGDELDIGDHADWGDARLLKPRGTAPVEPS